MITARRLQENTERELAEARREMAEKEKLIKSLHREMGGGSSNSPAIAREKGGVEAELSKLREIAFAHQQHNSVLVSEFAVEKAKMQYVSGAPCFLFHIFILSVNSFILVLESQ
mgnify:CR=1 FL=1